MITSMVVIFTLYSNHKPLQYLLNDSKHVPAQPSSSIQRWAVTLAAYSHTIRHIPGQHIPHADALSCLPLSDCPATVPLSHNVMLVLTHLSDMHQISSNGPMKIQTNQDH